ncbi:TonB-dependent receptor [Fulvivirgaceae bacterium BMA10]|uniref:TonB-dependent receptor n=1 Tax=Splendidivirga corallicola TaxID=3051826 RepID=A0ABT8KVX3_9BACT|nr:TonB-dependent receptor [Fulvivirgaceae bacterium BMA10]
MSNKYLLTLLMMAVFQYAAAQSSADPVQSEDQTEVSGHVVDANSGQSLEYATVSIFDKAEKRLMTGSITDGSGKFSIKTSLSDFYLEVAYLGYLTMQIHEFEIKENKVDLGLVKIMPDQKVLDEITVVGEKSQTTFHLDKRIFNVGKDLSTSGGNALDVLSNVPSVDVNIEGEISLRGNSNVQILINGKPSVIANSNALGTITAEMIEQVEVITNPSAKYDAEGTTGILNIILKKEDKKGLNGSVTLNTGVPNNHSIGLSLNRRTEKFNLYSQFGVGKRTFLSNYNGLTLDRLSANPRQLLNDGEGEKNEQFYNVILGTDYHINALNVVTLTGHFGYEIEDEFSTTNYDLQDEVGESINSSQRNEVTEATNPKWQYELQYKRSFKGNKDRALLASITGSFFGKDKSSNFENTNISGSFDDFRQIVKTDFSNAEFNYQIDYTHPFTKKNILETGAKYEINDNANDYRIDDVINGELVNNVDFTNEFEYLQKVLGVYATYSIEWSKISFKAGLRMENTDLNTFLVTGDERHFQEYTDLFPSFHTSYKVSDKLSLQAGYSRRIHRPNGWDLNPFTSIRDNLNQFVGNPNLLPEYTDSYEVTTIQEWNIASLNVAVFHRKTTDVVDRIIQVTDSLTISSPQNVGSSNNTGIEINGKIEPTKWLTVLADFNWMYFERTGNFENNVFDFNNTSWNSRLTTKFKFPNDITGEIRVRYRSEIQNLQAIIDDNIYADLGLKKKLFKGRTVINLSVRDVFNSRRFVSTADQPAFFRFNDSQRSQRRVVLGISYGFGKGDAIEYSGLKQF